MPLDTAAIRRQFPIFREEHPPIYLDSAAMGQKPANVIDAMDTYYRLAASNVHRGMYALADEATNRYEASRETVRAFIAAKHRDEIVFTKGATESINLVAKTWGKANLKKGDGVVLSILEHHSNIVPWLQLKEEIGISLRWIDMEEDGSLRMADIDAALKDGKAKLVSVTGLSNVLGTLPPLSDIIERAHRAHALTLIDASQLIAHRPIDVTELNCDFLAFSGHKLFGPTGIGVLYARSPLLSKIPPFLGGGGMVQRVTREEFLPADPPAKFEAGTPPIAEAIGLKAAIEWFTQYPWKDIEAHEHALLAHAIEKLKAIPSLRILGPASADEVAGCVSFTIEGVHPHDLTDILGRQGICLRAGHHCAQPLHERLDIGASTRLSVSLYNTPEEIDRCAEEIRRAIAKLKK
ncbi:TPA: cysteine desulfurase [Candidatus Peribacteria bacterium]|nr:MAG: hypothetical protein A2529_02800 [Candidatus Peribacteria bacterium RIFOXYD2_FULL_58_15]HAI98186.1 cysteine desulfurase [Candidatus Peribacteria bacterium]HAS34533.1 cysteine desulfurase [Candidatus Peribacteria bacterium]